MSVHSTYGDRATIVFHESKHYYTVTVPSKGISKLYQPGVTTVLHMKAKPFLVPWACGQMSEKLKELVSGLADEQLTQNLLLGLIDYAEGNYEKVKEDAAEMGKITHRYFEALLNGGSPIMPEHDPILAPQLTQEMLDKASKSIEAGLRFFREHCIKVIQTEAPRWSPTYGYIGTGDLIAMIDGELSVLDYKTGKYIYPEYHLQTAAYQVAFHEEFPEQEPTARWLVNVGRDGHLTGKKLDNVTLRSDFKTFLALLQVWRWDRENDPKNPREAPAIVGPLT